MNDSDDEGFAFWPLQQLKTVTEETQDYFKFEKKLEFLKAAGVFSSRSLARLNTIRNRMEHDYEVPKVADIESYFDLVAAFVSVLELTAILHTEVECSKKGSSGLLIDGYLSITYQMDSPSILAR